MLRIKGWYNDSSNIEQNKERLNQIKLKGSEKDIRFLEEIFDEAERNGQCQIISKSELLNNKGSEDKRKFIALKFKEE